MHTPHGVNTEILHGRPNVQCESVVSQSIALLADNKHHTTLTARGEVDAQQHLGALDGHHLLQLANHFQRLTRHGTRTGQKQKQTEFSRQRVRG